VPFGRLADRVNRVHMIAAGLTLWSVASGLTGLMDSFAGLFLCRVLVGVGEATLGPAAISLLADSFPAERRANANAIYAAGVPLGAALAMFGGGAIGQAWGWRGAFFALGFPGVLLALVLLLAVREPARGAFPSPPAAHAAPQHGGWRAIVNNPVLRLHTAGYACFALAANAVSMWMPALLGARFHLTLAEVGTTLSNVNLQLQSNTNLVRNADLLTRDVASLAVTLETLFKRHWLFRSAYRTNQPESPRPPRRPSRSPKESSPSPSPSPSP
jgi:MFS family permease